MNKRDIMRGAIVFVVVSLIIFLIYTFTQKSDVRGEEIEVKKADISTYYNFSGSIEAKNKSTLFAELPIQISEFLVEKGQQVKKGDTVYKDSTGKKVKADIAGEVSKISVEKDAQLTPGTEVMQIVDYSSLELKVKVDEYDLNSIKVGTPVEVTINALDKTFKGKIVNIERQGVYVDGVTFFETTISIDNAEGIRVGMSAEAKVLDKESKQTKILPMTAISFRNDNTPYIKIKNEKNIEEKEIKIGITDGVNVEIKSGLEVGDKVFVPTVQKSNFGPPEGARNSNDQKQPGGSTNE